MIATTRQTILIISLSPRVTRVEDGGDAWWLDALISTMLSNTAQPSLADESISPPFPGRSSYDVATALLPPLSQGDWEESRETLDHSFSSSPASALASFIYDSARTDLPVTSVVGCSICLEDWVDGDCISVIPCAAAHHFHTNCISPWLICHNQHHPMEPQRCPYCRQTFSMETARTPSTDREQQEFEI